MRLLRYWLLRGLIFVSPLALMACNGQPEASDGYRFQHAEFVHLEPEVTFVVHRNLDDLRRHAPSAANAQLEGGRRALFAWSVLTGPTHNRCEVHIVDPTVSYEPEWIGHEVAHCIYGRWHQ